MGEVFRVPISEGPVTAELSYTVVHRRQCELNLGGPSMKRMRAQLDFDKDATTSVTKGKWHRLC